MALEISERMSLAEPLRKGVNAAGGYIAVARRMSREGRIVRPSWFEKALCPTDPTHKMDLYEMAELLDLFSDDDFDAVLGWFLARRGRLPPMARPRLISQMALLMLLAEFHAKAGILSGTLKRAHEKDSDMGEVVSPREAKDIVRTVNPVAVPLFEIHGAAQAIASGAPTG